MRAICRSCTGAASAASIVSFAGVCTAALFALGCGTADRAWGDAPGAGGQATSAGRAAFPIIGGAVAPSPALDHTGAIMYRDRATGEVSPLCTGTLLGPETIVTAKHCIIVLPIFERIGLEVLFAVGPDHDDPIDLIPVVAMAGAPGDEGGQAGYGRDVGVAHLERPVLGVTPAVARPFTVGLLGVTLVTLGYGMSSADGAIDGLRRIGRETVEAVSGSTYAAMFGDFESFAERMVRNQLTEPDIFRRSRTTSARRSKSCTAAASCSMSTRRSPVARGRYAELPQRLGRTAGAPVARGGLGSLRGGVRRG